MTTWKDCSVELPADGIEVRIHTVTSDGQRGDSHRAYRDCGRWMSDSGVWIMVNVTHWEPYSALPASDDYDSHCLYCDDLSGSQTYCKYCGRGEVPIIRHTHPTNPSPTKDPT